MDMARLSALPYFMERFQNSVAQYPQQPMLVDARHPKGLTRRDVDELSARVYAYLKQRGVGREDMVMICLPRGAEIVIAMYGVWKAGAALTVAEDDLPPERLAFIKADCGCACVIHSALWPEIMRTPPLHGFERADDHDAAFALYTSGSTGEPKGVLQEYGCFRLYALAEPRPAATPEAAFAETFLSPFSTLVGVHFAMKHIDSLESMHILPKEISQDPQRLNRYFTEHGIAHTFLTPSMLRALGGDLSPSLRVITVLAEGANDLYLDGVTLENGYSMSEAGVPLCYFIIDRPYAHCPVGKPSTDLIRLHLLDEEGKEVPAGAVGEICFETPFFRGYINRPEETKAAFRGGLFHSGDLGKWDENGNLVLTGRASEMLKIGGNRVEPSEIEAAFRKITGKDWCAVKGFDNGPRTLLCLYYRGEHDLDAPEMRREMGGYLPGYMIPAKFQRIETVPLLPSGKTDKAALPEPDFSDRPVYAAPVTETEQALCRAFEAVFEIAPIGLDDDFFDLGGDSLYATSILVESDLETLSAQDIYTGGTPRQIAALYERHLAQDDGASASAEELLQRTKAHLLTPNQHTALSYTHAENFGILHLFRFPAETDAERLCDAFNSALANRPALSMILERGPSGEITQRYDPARTVRASVHTLDEAEFQSRLTELKQPFQMFGAPLCHAGIYRTEQNVYLFLDVSHVMADGGAFGLLFADLVRAWRGEKPELDTYCTYLARERKLLDSDEYRSALEYLNKRYYNASWCKSIRHDAPPSAPGGLAMTPFRRMLTHAEAKAFESRTGHSRNTLFMAVAFLTLYKSERQQRCRLVWTFHNRTDKVSRNAFGCLARGQLLLGVGMRDGMTVKHLLREILNQKNASIISGIASEEKDASEKNSGFRVVYQSSDITTSGGLSELGGQPVDLQKLMISGKESNPVEVLLLINEMPQIIAPVLIMDQTFYTAEKQQATLDTADDLLTRLLAVEDPERTTVGELLG